MIFHLKIDFTFITLYIYRGTLMKKLIFGIALILFGFSMAYLSAQAQWAIMQAVSLLAVFAGLLFAVWGLIEKE